MLTALVLAGVVAAAPQPALAPGTYIYHATYGGQSVGTSTIVVKTDGATTELDERVTGDFQGTAASGTATLMLASDLSPSRYDVSGNVGGLPTRTATEIADGTATVKDGKRQTDVPLATGSQHFVIVDLGTFVGFMPLAAQMKAWNDVQVTAVIPSFGQSLAIAPSANVAQARPSDVPAGDQSISFAGEEPFTIWYDPATFVPDEIVTSQGITVTRDATAH